MPCCAVDGTFDFSELRTGSTIVIRYAQRCFFSDLATEAIKVRALDGWSKGGVAGARGRGAAGAAGVVLGLVVGG